MFKKRDLTDYKKKGMLHLEKKNLIEMNMQ